MHWIFTRKWRPLSVIMSLMLALVLAGSPLAEAATGPTATQSTTVSDSPFIDLGNHWAKSSILWLVQRGFVNGSENDLGEIVVRPDDPVTRAEVVKMIAGMKGLDSASDAQPFSDAQGHWASGYLAAAKAAGIAQGYPDGTFHPNGLITRAELAAFVGRAFAQQGQTTGRAFPDVPSNHWAYATIKAAVGNGWIRGFTDGTYKPDQQATRAEAFTILARVDDQQGLRNAITSVATRNAVGTAKQHMQAAVSALDSYGGLLAAGKLTGLQGDLTPAWSDLWRIPDAAVFDHQGAMVIELSSQWESGKLRYPVALNAMTDLLLSARLGAESATTDAEMVLGLQGHPAAQMPKGTDPTNWTVAKSLAGQARQVLTSGKEALAKGNASAAISSFRQAWEAGTRAISLAGIQSTPAPDSDLDKDRVPDEIELRFGANPLLSDTDGDGLTDYFEIQYGGPIFQPGIADTDGNGITDGEEDTDEDGLTNLQEQKYGTNPLRADTDGDGLSDGEEVKLGTNPLKPDTDGDGISDGTEVRLETSPRVRDANAKATTSVQTPDGAVTVAGPAASVANVQVVAEDQTPYQGMPGQVGKVTDFTAAGPIDSARIELPVDPEALEGHDLSHLRIFYFDEALKTWRLVEGEQGFDPETGRFWAETAHFSAHMIMDEVEWAGAWSAKTACGTRSQEASPKPVDVVLAIDSSGSMEDNDPDELRKSGAVQMVLSLLKGDRVAVVDFDSSTRLLRSLTGEFAPVYDAIQKIDAYGGTSVDGGIRAGLAELKDSPADRSRIIVLLTDGQNYPTSFDRAVIDQAVAAGVTIFTLGLGEDIDKPLLEQIAETTGGRFFQVLTADDLPKAFSIVNTNMGVIDSDGDGLSDCEESKGMLDAQGRRWYTDPQKADTDGDGLTDREEMGQYVEPVLIAGNPLKTPYWQIASDPTKADGDGDGLDDLTERSLGTSPLRVDSDNDGLTDKEEQDLGTNPLLADTDYDTIDDASEVYSLYLNPLVPDEFLVSSDEWKVEFYKGFKLGDNCVKTDAQTELRRCLGTLPFKLGQGASDLAAPLSTAKAWIDASSEYMLGLVGVVGEHLVNLTGNYSFRVDAYYNAPTTQALSDGEAAGDAIMGFTLEVLLVQAQVSTDVANFLFGSDLSVDGLRDYMDEQSKAFWYGRTSSDVFQTIAGVVEFVAGVATILGSLTVGVTGAVGSVALVPVSGGASLGAGVVVVEVAIDGAITGTVMIGHSVLMMARSSRRLTDALGNVPKGGALGNRAHAERLAKNMTSAGRPRPGTDYRAAHVVPSGWAKNKEAQWARDILARLGIDIDDPVNGVWLKQDFHGGPGVHTNRGMEFVWDELHKAELTGTSLSQKRTAVVKALRRIADQLSSGVIPWKE